MPGCPVRCGRGRGALRACGAGMGRFPVGAPLRCGSVTHDTVGTGDLFEGDEPAWLPVEGGLVHKVRPEGVLLGEYVSEDAASLCARVVPRSPGCGDDRMGSGVDVLVLVEVFRQLTILAGHVLFDVAPDAAFVMDRLAVRLAPEREFAGRGVVERARLRVLEVEYRGSRLHRLSVAVDFLDEAGGEVASGDGCLRLLPRGVYQRLRGTRAGVSSADLPRSSSSGGPLELRLLGRGRRGGTWEVGFDPQDRFFFDHPVDHVPGMLLVHVMREAAMRSVGAGAVCTRVAVEFVRYLELDEPVFVRVRQASRTDFVGTVSLSVVVVGANRREAAAGTIDLRTPKVGAV